MEAYIHGYRRAARHLLAVGLLPALCVPELQQLWTGSREDRALVRLIAESWEVQGP